MELVTVDELLKHNIKGKIVCFPTDTVYGVGALVDDIEAIDKIYQLKNRDYSKPLAVLTATYDISQYVKGVNVEINNIMKKYWPGALTCIFYKNENIDRKITAGFETIGLRMPALPIALKILNHFGLMATTSINLSGDKPINNLEEIISHFGEQIDYIVIDKATLSNVSSTVIDVTKTPFTIIRQGDIYIDV